MTDTVPNEPMSDYESAQKAYDFLCATLENPLAANDIPIRKLIREQTPSVARTFLLERTKDLLSHEQDREWTEYCLYTVMPAFEQFHTGNSEPLRQLYLVEASVQDRPGAKKFWEIAAKGLDENKK